MSQERLNFFAILTILLVLSGDVIALFLEINNQQQRREDDKKQAQSDAKIQAQIQELHNEIALLKLAQKEQG